MPLYEYRCQSCGEVFEVIQRFSDEPLKVHQECGGVVERLISPPAFQFKGSGWYVTDYARASNGKGGSHGHEHKTDAKPAETAAAKTDTPAKAKTEPAAKPK